jgi:hypothetical protein
MEIKEIIESGFVKAFIAEYFEDKIHSFYPDKDSLLYVLCGTDIEKQQVTAKQIEVVKSEIQKLGNEDLSFEYLLSSKPKTISGLNYIEPDKRFDFWLNRFCEVFIDSINTFIPIIDAYKLFKTKISNEDFENEFWEMYPASQKPKENCLPFVIQRESELKNEIEYTISEYKENEYWEFDFEEYQKFIDTSKPIELLFNVSELLVQLNRLEMFNEFLLPPQQTETETEQGMPTFTNNFDNNKTTEIYKHFKAGLVEKGYLTEQELNEYLKAAFELKTKPETLFKLKHTPTKQKIYTVFYIYYKDISQKKHERQKEYAALLGDFFEGYKTEIIQTNWARDYKTKR